MSPRMRRLGRLAAGTLTAAALTATPAAADDGKLVIGASSVKDLTREYSDGRKETGCRVVFTLTNRTGKGLRAARFWVAAENGKREAFGLNDRRTTNGETFDRTPCAAVRGKLRLVRALCIWTGEKQPVDCIRSVVVKVN